MSLPWHAILLCPNIGFHVAEGWTRNLGSSLVAPHTTYVYCFVFLLSF